MVDGLMRVILAIVIVSLNFVVVRLSEWRMANSDEARHYSLFATHYSLLGLSLRLERCVPGKLGEFGLARGLRAHEVGKYLWRVGVGRDRHAERGHALPEQI